MADIVDLTKRIQSKRWQTTRELEFAVRFITAARTTVKVSEEIVELLTGEPAERASWAQRMSAQAMARFCKVALDMIDVVYERILATGHINATEEYEIIVLEAMHKELRMMHDRLLAEVEAAKPSKPS